MDGRVKFPRIPQLPWSPGRTPDDLVLEDLRAFEHEEVVVLEKMDGECTTMTTEYVHARSTDSRDHPSRHWVKAQHAMIAPQIPPHHRICGENCFARHSIAYDRLPSYLLAFAAFNDREGMCLSWDDTVTLVQPLGLVTVPLLWRGTWNPRMFLCNAVDVWQPQAGPESEGYVVRLARAFPIHAFRRSVAKYVRAGHVQTDAHWLERAVVRNGLTTESRRIS